MAVQILYFLSLLTFCRAFQIRRPEIFHRTALVERVLASEVVRGCPSYTVVSGDYCYAIGARYSISVAQLQSYNPGLNCNNLQIGQVLCVGASSSCPTYTVKSGDYCYAIGQAYGISVAQLQSDNPGLNCNNLQIGQVLCVGSGGSPTPPTPPTSGAYTSAQPIWATWYCSLTNPGQYSACGSGSPAVADCGNVNIYGLPGSAQGIAANNPLAFTNGGSYTCHWNGASCGNCYNLQGPSGSRKVVISDCCAGYPGNTQCTASNPPGNCDWCAANANWHFDLDVDSYLAVCGNLDAGSCQLRSATPTAC
jgi:LysM repeat protein